MKYKKGIYGEIMDKSINVKIECIHWNEYSKKKKDENWNLKTVIKKDFSPIARRGAEIGWKGAVKK